MKNSQIKSFDTEMGALINKYLGEGIEITTATIILEKYLLDARRLEKEIIDNEEKAFIEQMQANIPTNAPEETFPEEPIFVEATEDSNEECTDDTVECGYGENKNDPEMDPEWDMK